MKVGIFGGTFNPIHHGHLIIASYIYENTNLDKIVFIPAGSSPFNKGEIAFEDRINMVNLAIEGDERFLSSTIEDRRGKSYTIDTLERIRESRDDDLYFIMGLDAYVKLDSWHRYRDILSTTKIIVVDRGEGSFDKNLYKGPIKGIKHLEGPRLDISSTNVRDLIKRKKSIRYLVPERVRLYIERKKLYR